MKWRFVLKGLTTSDGSICGPAGVPADGPSWILSSEPTLPSGTTGRRSGRESLLKLARRICAYGGGRIIVIKDGNVTHAFEWRDVGEVDLE